MDVFGFVTGWASWIIGYAVPFLFVLTIVVFFHELGHFLVARWCGVKVTAFAVGFGRELIGFTDRKDTRWKLCAIPLGGYVKFYGDENAASAPDFEANARMSEAERKVSFLHKPVAQRAAVVAAGPIANFILAIVIFAASFMIAGRPVIPANVEGVKAGSPAEQAGIRVGDRIVGVNGEEIDSLGELQRIVSALAGEKVAVTYDRGGVRKTVDIVPELVETKTPLGPHRVGLLGIAGPAVPARVEGVAAGGPADKAGLKRGDLVIAIGGKPVNSFAELREALEGLGGVATKIVLRRDGAVLDLDITPKLVERKVDGKVVNFGQLGVQPPALPDGAVTKFYGPVEAVKLGALESYFVAERTLTYLKRVIGGRESADQLGGPIRIALVSNEVASAGVGALLLLAAVLSVSIGLVNLFPVPLLDGGHLVFYAIEAIRGRPLSERAQEVGFRIGLALVLMLMMFATWNDIRLLASF